MIAEISEISDDEEELVPIEEKYITLDWYKEVFFVLQHNKAPADLIKSKARFFKLKSLRYFIFDRNLFGKDTSGILLNCLLEDNADKLIEEFHKGYCGGHHYWKAIVNKILRSGYYWPTMFKDVYKRIAACHECDFRG